MRSTHRQAAMIAAVMAPAAPALAQQAADQVQTSVARPGDVSDTPGDIVVTARRVEERLQDVPISITVFSQQQLSANNVINAQDLANYTPSLSANSNYGSENSSFAIRGFVQDPGTAPSVGVYFADVVSPRGSGLGGIPAGDGAGPGSFFDLQNVQVLKGPQGTLFGRNTTGGAILLVPQRPTSDLGGYAEVSLGNYDMRRAQAALNVPLSDGARLRIAGDYQQRDGTLRNNSGIGPDRLGNINYFALRASLVLDLTPDVENYTIASYLESDTRGSVQRVVACNPTQSLQNFLGLLACGQLARNAGADFYTVQSLEPDPRSQLNQWQVINTTTWRVTDDIRIRNIVSYAQLRQTLRSSLYGTDYRLGPLQLPFVQIAPAPGLRSADQSTFTEELQLQGTGAGGRLTYQFGGYYETSEPLRTVGNRGAILTLCTDPATLQCIAPIPGGSAVADTASESSFRSIGLYAQASYRLSDQLSVSGGIRYTWDRSTNDIARITYIFPQGAAVPICTDFAAVAPACRQSLRQSSEAPTWMLGVDYRPIDDILLYGKYSRGYRSGGIFPNSPANYRLFDPEQVDAYELGAKFTFRGPIRGTFNVAGFYNDFTNQQLQVPFNPAPNVPVAPTQGIVNAGTSRIYGVEVEAAVELFAGFRVTASYAYLNARIRQIDPLVSLDPNYVINFQILPGQPLIQSPAHDLSATANYMFDLPAGLGALTLGATFTHTSSQLNSYAYNDPAVLAAFGSNLSRLPPRDLVNLNVQWADVGGLPVDLSLFVTNVTDEEYFAFVPGVAAAGFEAAVLGEPRMFGARLRYRFGAR